MKPVFIQFTDHEGKVTKTFTTVSIKTGLMDKVLDIAEREEELKNMKDVKQIKEFMMELKTLIVSVFGGQFTYDELNEHVDNSEMMDAFYRIVGGLTGSMTKN